MATAIQQWTTLVADAPDSDIAKEGQVDRPAPTSRRKGQVIPAIQTRTTPEAYVCSIGIAVASPAGGISGRGHDMRRWIIAAVVGLFLFGLTGFVLTYVQKIRRNADVKGCQQHLSMIGLFAAQHAKTKPGDDPGKVAAEIPPGTIVLPGIEVQDRLSWLVGVLPGLDQRRQTAKGSDPGRNRSDQAMVVRGKSEGRENRCGRLFVSWPSSRN